MKTDSIVRTESERLLEYLHRVFETHKWFNSWIPFISNDIPYGDTFGDVCYHYINSIRILLDHILTLAHTSEKIIFEKDGIRLTFWFERGKILTKNEQEIFQQRNGKEFIFVKGTISLSACMLITFLK